MTWQLHEAKRRFSELVREAETNGPQVVTRRGREVVVVVAAEQYRRLRAARPSFKEFLLSGPRSDGLQIELDRGPVRHVAATDARLVDPFED